MKKFKKIVCLVLALTIMCSFSFSCDSKSDKEVELTNIDFVKDGKTDYKIVVPKKASDIINQAADELVNLTLEASGAKLPVVTDDTVTYSKDAKFLSLGNTTLLESSKIKVDSKDLNTEGFYLKTVGNTVFMIGAVDDGSMYAAYEFLERTFNYKFLSPDETVFDANQNVKLSKFNIKQVPAFAHRNNFWMSHNNNANVRGRFRTHNNDQWGLFAHSYFQLVPPGEYMEDHKDWFYPVDSPEPKQLCLTADGMIDVLVKNLEGFILAKKNSRYFMVGQEDTNCACTCAKCTASNEKNGGISGTMMVFVNEVARRIKEWQKTDAWLKSENPNRQIWIATFAYQKTRPAPAVFNSKDGSYSPANSAVIAEDNVLVQYAPLESCYAHSLYDDCNKPSRTSIEGWKTITKNFAIWSYCTNFTNYLLHFNNLGSLQDDYRIYKEMGTEVIMDQGTGETTMSPFHDLRAYLHAKLMWDVEANMDDIVNEFIAGYYKDAATPIREYYDLIRLHYTKLDADYQAKNNGKPFDSYIYNTFQNNNEDSAYWKKSFLDQVMNKLNQALSIAAGIEDKDVRERVRLRILAETLSIRYLYIEFYIGDYMYDEQEQMIDKFAKDAEEVGLVCWAETTPTQAKLAAWRTKIRG